MAFFGRGFALEAFIPSLMGFVCLFVCSNKCQREHLAAFCSLQLRVAIVAFAGSKPEMYLMFLLGGGPCAQLCRLRRHRKCAGKVCRLQLPGSDRCYGLMWWSQRRAAFQTFVILIFHIGGNFQITWGMMVVRIWGCGGRENPSFLH